MKNTDSTCTSFSGTARQRFHYIWVPQGPSSNLVLKNLKFQNPFLMMIFLYLRDKFDIFKNLELESYHISIERPLKVEVLKIHILMSNEIMKEMG